jgi:triosephosphate isomerase
MRRPFIAGNWKMNTDLKGAIALASGIREQLAGVKDVDVGVFPPAIFLADVADALTGSRVIVGTQNMHHEKEGAFTGEISGPMIRSVGGTHVIIGHSERRHIFGETDRTVNLKTKAAFAFGLTPIVCVGEKLEEREAGQTASVVERHVRTAFDGLSAEQAKATVIAYEPVWAIGTGKTATPEQANEVHALIRKLLAKLHNADVAQAVRIQYGGSVKPENAKGLMAQPEVDGFLVGGASLKVDSFVRIVRYKE